MEKLERTIIVSASPMAVYNYLSDARHLEDLIPGAEEVEITAHIPHGGWKFNWKRLLCGVHFVGKGECIEHLPHQRLRYRLNSGLNNEVGWLLKPVPYGTAVTMHLTFDVPTPLGVRHSLQELRSEYIEQLEHILGGIALALNETKTAQEDSVPI
jgi:hypothetical protein